MKKDNKDRFTFTISNLSVFLTHKILIKTKDNNIFSSSINGAQSLKKRLNITFADPSLGSIKSLSYSAEVQLHYLWPLILVNNK